MRNLLLHAFFRVSLAGILCNAQAQPPDFDAASRASVVERVVIEMNDRYVFPDIARACGVAVMQQAGALAAIADPQRFADRLTEILQGVTHDKHVRVRYQAESIADDAADEPSPATVERERSDAMRFNNGIERVERLPGNIGYVEIRAFFDPRWANETIATAMTLIAHTDALIIDLRRNGGGEPATVAFMISYLFDHKTHLNDLHWRKDDRIEEFWTATDVPGSRFGGTKPLFVLTSSRTFSGAEEFSYDLQNLKRATLVGETTAGGANPGSTRRLSAHFEVFVPEGRAVNPVTKTNWEGVGVVPDVAVAAPRALDAAQELALAVLIANERDTGRKAALEGRLAQLRSAAATALP